MYSPIVLKYLMVVLLVPLFGSAAADESLAKVKFKLCNAEGFQALNIARNFILSGKKKESVLQYITEDEFEQKLAKELFERVNSGEIKHYADFATEKLFNCSEREGVPLDKPRDDARLCFARVDIPFFLMVDKDEGINKEKSIARTSQRLKDRELYPLKLISSVADRAFSLVSLEEHRKLMGLVFWSCLYNDEWSKE